MGAAAHGVEKILVVLGDRQHHDLDIRESLRDLARRVQPGCARMFTSITMTSA